MTPVPDSADERGRELEEAGGSREDDWELDAGGAVGGGRRRRSSREIEEPGG